MRMVLGIFWLKLVTVSRTMKVTAFRWCHDLFSPYLPCPPTCFPLVLLLWCWRTCKHTVALASMALLVIAAHTSVRHSCLQCSCFLILQYTALLTTTLLTTGAWTGNHSWCQWWQSPELPESNSRAVRSVLCTASAALRIGLLPQICPRIISQPQPLWIFRKWDSVYIICTCFLMCFSFT